MTTKNSMFFTINMVETERYFNKKSLTCLALSVIFELLGQQVYHSLNFLIADSDTPHLSALSFTERFGSIST